MQNLLLVHFSIVSGLYLRTLMVQRQRVQKFRFLLFFHKLFLFYIQLRRGLHYCRNKYNEVNIVKNNHNNDNEMGEKSFFLFGNKCFIF